MLLSFVVPVFRSENTLASLYENIKEECLKQGFEYQIIFVEDCGGDRSWEILTEIAANNDSVVAIQLSRNFGQHNALLCGIHQAKGDIIITLDDDGQHPIEEIGKLLKPLDNGFDVVYGTPITEPHSMARAFASRLTKLVLQKVIGAESATKVSAFRAFRSSLVKAFSDYRSPNVNVDVLLTWGTTRFSNVAVEHRHRVHGESGYTFLKLVQHSMNMMTGFSTLPLQLASYLGFIFSGLGFLSLLYVLLVYVFRGAVVPGFAFLGCLISVFSGVQLLSIGIIGEYLGRIHLSTMDRPPYVIREGA